MLVLSLAHAPHAAAHAALGGLEGGGGVLGVSALQLHLEVLHLFHDPLAQVLLLRDLLLELHDALEVLWARLARDQLELQLLHTRNHSIVRPLELLLRRLEHLLRPVLVLLMLCLVLALHRLNLLLHPKLLRLHLLQELHLEPLHVLSHLYCLPSALLALCLLGLEGRLHRVVLSNELLDLALGVCLGLPEGFLTLLLPCCLALFHLPLVLLNELPQVRLALGLGLLLLASDEGLVLVYE
mmetsp:Transcript_12262/g.29993  ORF Transcript_12262/g.29993 Transcript_12262/m.29993 type:complete len:240 (-) Transcript_12262:1841-2560(-)